jgi:hypothetical protein
MCGATRDVRYGPKADIQTWALEGLKPFSSSSGIVYLNSRNRPVSATQETLVHESDGLARSHAFPHLCGGGYARAASGCAPFRC